MEEEERYEIHIYDDVCVDLYNNGVLDKSINDTYKLEKLLNQQDKENQQLKDRWQKLKDDLMLFYTVGGTLGSYGYNIYKSIFDKMEELEGAKK